jgi:hypothetical protein
LSNPNKKAKKEEAAEEAVDSEREAAEEAVAEKEAVEEKKPSGFLEPTSEDSSTWE